MSSSPTLSHNHFVRLFRPPGKQKQSYEAGHSKDLDISSQEPKVKARPLWEKVNSSLHILFPCLPAHLGAFPTSWELAGLDFTCQIQGGMPERGKHPCFLAYNWQQTSTFSFRNPRSFSTKVCPQETSLSEHGFNLTLRRACTDMCVGDHFLTLLFI